MEVMLKALLRIKLMKQKKFSEVPKKKMQWSKQLIIITIFIGSLLLLATIIMVIVYWDALIKIFQQGTWIIILLILAIIAVISLAGFIISKVKQHMGGY